MADDPRLDALRALADTALRLGRGTTTARLALAGLHETVDPEALPPEVRGRVTDELARAHAASTAPLSTREVERALKEAWGRAARDVLDDLDPDPVAVTPTSQVHRAAHDGRPVAVKVLRPQIADGVRQDLGLLETLVRPIGGVFPSLAPGLLLAEVRERVLDELDLAHEASTQRAFARALRRHEQLTVPAPVGELCEERVLVSDWLDGTPVGELTDPQERAAAARALVRFHVGSARFGTVHADPHPRNALLLGDGRLAILDFGAVRRVPTARVDEAALALAALLDGDAAALGGSLQRLGWLPAALGPTALELARELLSGHLDGPSRLDARVLRGIGERTEAAGPALWPLAQATSVPPEDLWPLRMLGALAGLLARLEVEDDWPALVRDAVERGW